MPQQKYELRGVATLAMVAAAIATACDGIHVYTQTLSYPKPFLFGQAWFVFPGFTVTFAVMALGYGWLAQRLPGQSQPNSRTSSGSIREAVESIVAFVLVYVLSGFGNRDPMFLSLLFYVTVGIRLAYTHDAAFMTVLAVILGGAGIVAEGSMTGLDLVHYRQPEVYGVPLWLGGLYMHGAFALRDGMRLFVYRPTEDSDRRIASPVH